MFNPKTPPKLLSCFFIVTALAVQSGCAVLIGNVKPVEEKAENYGVMDLSKASPDWIKLEPSAAQKEDNLAPTEVADVAYQSKKTSSVISLNSACRTSNEPGKDQSLDQLTNLLTLGMTNTSQREERPLIIGVIPALETTLQGKLNGEEMKLRTVVLKKGACVYDLVYLARPKHFATHLNDFSHFVDSLRLK